jgi:hypothetical protein
MSWISRTTESYIRAIIDANTITQIVVSDINGASTIFKSDVIKRIAVDIGQSENFPLTCLYAYRIAGLYVPEFNIASINIAYAKINYFCAITSQKIAFRK